MKRYTVGAVVTPWIGRGAMGLKKAWCVYRHTGATPHDDGDSEVVATFRADDAGLAEFRARAYAEALNGRREPLPESGDGPGEADPPDAAAVRAEREELNRELLGRRVGPLGVEWAPEATPYIQLIAVAEAGGETRRLFLRGRTRFSDGRYGLMVRSPQDAPSIVPMSRFITQSLRNVVKRAKEWAQQEQDCGARVWFVDDEVLGTIKRRMEEADCA